MIGRIPYNKGLPSPRRGLSSSLKGKPSPHKGKQMRIVSCPHCSVEGGVSQMKRWHFDNCKLKDTIE